MSSTAFGSWRFDYVAVGLTLLDVLARPVVAFPDGDAVGFVEEIRTTPAGTAAGPAAVAAKLGLRTRLVGAVGDDEIGRILLRALDERGVDTACIERIAGQRTSATVLGIRPNGERPALHAIGASLSLAIPESAWDDVLAAPVLHLGGVGALPRLDGASSAALLREAKQRGVLVTCDLIAPGPTTLPALEAVLPFVDYFMPTAAEARVISGEATTEGAAAFFLDRGARWCVFKDGVRGCVGISRERHFAAPAFRVRVVDTTGCGDSFCAGFGAARSRGLDEEESARFACATAALVATGLGTDTAAGSFEQVKAALAELAPLAPAG